MTIALIAIPLGIGVVLSVVGTQFVRVATDPHRRQEELFGAGAGLAGGGVAGLVCSGTLAFLTGMIPLFGEGHLVMASVVIAFGTMGGALSGAWVGQVLGRRAVNRSG